MTVVVGAPLALQGHGEPGTRASRVNAWNSFVRIGVSETPNQWSIAKCKLTPEAYPRALSALSRCGSASSRQAASAIRESRVDTALLNESCNAVPTVSIISRMLLASKHVSDLFLSPGCQPSVKINGELISVQVPGIERLTAEDTARIAGDLIGSNRFAVQKLKEDGS